MEHWHWEAAEETKKKEKKPQGCLCEVMTSKRVQMSVPVILEEQRQVREGEGPISPGLIGHS